MPPRFIAGRYAGGSAKVAVLSSAMMRTITGSSIANAVTTGALTIPTLVRDGYQRHFAAAFLRIEFLGIPYTHIMIAALVSAFMHLFGVLTNGNTPYLAAFWGITFCIIIGLVNPRDRMTIGDVFSAFVVAAKYALAAGAAAATVGIMTPEGLTLLLALLLTAIVCILMGTGGPTTAAFPDYLTDRLYMWERWRLAIAAVLLVAPEIVTTIIGTAIFLPIFLRPLFRRHCGRLPS
ncbi:TRAP transporter large permease subunit [Rhodobacter sp. 24-YEA-8]|uniref:TRAP transporter large permease subunit n=1 Tax=Rhodobacter sp. 24-YEA-8 TaxID=1884310 RepID=UPI000A888CEB|nr:TRAP transporter large permease subunit [Rhodobacter sp. 24-YEA-8]